MTATRKTSHAANRSVTSAALRAKPTHVYKTDRRSRVWRLEGPHGPIVIKRFEYNRLIQWLAALLLIHPAQRERRRNRQLIHAGFSVPPVIGWGATRDGRFWLATPYQGPTLHRRICDRELDHPACNRSIAEAVGQFVGRLVAGGYFFRDLKTTNIIVDDDHRVWLIDVGSVRRLRSRQHVIRMIMLLDQTARRAGATRTTRLRCLKEMVRSRPSVGTVRQLCTQLSRGSDGSST